MQGGLGIVGLCAERYPSIYAIYSTLIFGASDPVATSGAAIETMHLHCPSCLEELKNFNAVALGGWNSSAYLLPARLHSTMADLKGKRVRATGGNAEMFKQAGMVPVGATLVEAVGLLQRGGIECQHGMADWLRTFGYADVAKYVIDYPLGMSGPAMGMYLNRDAWKAFTLDQKKVHLKHAAWLASRMAIGNFIVTNENTLDMIVKDKGVQIVKVGDAFDPMTQNYKKAQRDTNIATAKGFGVKEPAAILDYYEQAVERWRAVSKSVGRDMDKFADVLTSRCFPRSIPRSCDAGADGSCSILMLRRRRMPPSRSMAARSVPATILRDTRSSTSLLR